MLPSMQTPAGMIRTVNPATGAPLAEVPESTPAQVKEVVARARAARGSWAADFEARARALRAATQRVTEAAALEALARSITAEMGKPITEARAEIRGAMSRIDGYIDRARAALADERGSEHGLDVVVSWRPLGVVAVIAPWNYPVATPFNLLAAALLTGNTAIFKPSEYTPQTGATLHALLEALGGDRSG